jgi:hypothetical protein
MHRAAFLLLLLPFFAGCSKSSPPPEKPVTPRLMAALYEIPARH